MKSSKLILAALLLSSTSLSCKDFTRPQAQTPANSQDATPDETIQRGTIPWSDQQLGISDQEATSKNCDDAKHQGPDTANRDPSCPQPAAKAPGASPPPASATPTP